MLFIRYSSNTKSKKVKINKLLSKVVQIVINIHIINL